MQTVIKNAHIYTGTEEYPNGYLRFNQRVIGVGPMTDFIPSENDQNVLDASGQVMVPGFIDIHCHGGYGIDTMDADPDQIDRMVHQMTVNEGVTTVFPTTVTQSVDRFDRAVKAVSQAALKNPVIQGIHLEGPFINEKYKGAQPAPFIKSPDPTLLKQWQKLANGMVKIITYAPEMPQARELEKACFEDEVIASAGHTDATYEQMQNSQASHVTHLYNAQRGLHHRQPGVTGYALLNDQITGEIIADGFHVVPEMVKLAYLVMGAKRLELVTDAMRAKGLPDGESELGGQKVIVKEGQARLESGNLAGSVLLFKQAFKNIIAFTGCSINEAVQMASVNQAREFNLPQKGILESGRDADFNLLSADLELAATYSYGQLV